MKKPLVLFLSGVQAGLHEFCVGYAIRFADQGMQCAGTILRAGCSFCESKQEIPHRGRAFDLDDGIAAGCSDGYQDPYQ